MKRHLFLGFLLGFFTVFFCSGVHAKSERLPAPVPTACGKKIEVVELFWYGCPHCFELEPQIEAWAKKLPSYACFRRVPAAFDEGWAPLAQVYYAFDAMGVAEKWHKPFFDATHKTWGRLPSFDMVKSFVRAQGGDEKLFVDTFNSFGVKEKVRQTIAYTKEVQAQGVPTLVIDGKVRLETARGQGWDDFLEEARKTIEAERAHRP